MRHAALFVGGPWDGEMRMMECEYPVYVVQTHQALAFARDLRIDQPVVNEYATNVEYRRQELAGRAFYLVELSGYEERRNTKHPMERLVHMLTFGYKRV